MGYRSAGHVRLTVAISCVLIAVGLLGCALTDGRGAYESIRSFEVGDEVTVRGVVVENTIDPCLFPGDVPCVEGIGHILKVEGDDHSIVVRYGGHHDGPCPNGAANEAAAGARVGVSVEVFALVTSVGPDRLSLSVCESTEYWVEASR